MNDIKLIDKPDDKAYLLASKMTGLSIDEIKELCPEDKNKCNVYPVRCITTMCSCVEQCYGIQILAKYR